MSGGSDSALHDAQEGGDDALYATAADWLLRVAEDPALSAACDAWRAADLRHEAAFADVETAWARAPELEAALAHDWRAEAAGLAPMAAGRAVPTTGRRSWFVRSPQRYLVPTALAASIAMFLAMPSLVASGDAYSTPVGETREVALVDGSKITLGGRSDVDVRFSKGERTVMMGEGEAFFEVAHDSSRPFTVIAGDTEVRVTGTKFDVRRVGDKVEVSVLEGRVELRQRALLPMLRTEAPERVLAAGQRSEKPEAASFTPVAEAVVTPGEWRSGRLFYAEAPLSEIAADVERYNRVRIEFASPEVASMKVTTSFRADNVTQFSSNLEASLGLSAKRRADGSILIKDR